MAVHASSIYQRHRKLESKFSGRTYELEARLPWVGGTEHIKRVCGEKWEEVQGAKAVAGCSEGGGA